MKLLISIVSYLLKDIFWRWREQPGNVLTRFTVAYALVLPSLALLGTFVLMAENLETRLKRSGIDTLFVTQHISAASDDVASGQIHPRMDPLKRYGTVFQLLQLFVSAKTPHGSMARVAAYPDSTLSALSGLITRHGPILFFSDTLPVGMPIRTEIDNHFFTARVCRLDGLVEKFFQGNVVLVPEGMLPRVENRGFSRVMMLKANHIDEIAALQRAVQLTAKLDDTKVYVRSSLKLLADLNTLKSKQVRWRLGLAGASGGVLALVLGTLAVLEYQQRSYVIALLRSFGVRRSVVYAMQLFENALIVNGAGIAAYFTLTLTQSALYRSFGAGSIASGLSSDQMSAEIVMIFVCINIGVLLSTLPALHVLRKDIGTILS
ncbi:MAG: hypothetical protein KJN98_05505 [Pontiella sp.]|nr:hypothetical protein [Pontiella sp.]